VKIPLQGFRALKSVKPVWKRGSIFLNRVLEKRNLPDYGEGVIRKPLAFRGGQDAVSR
jgi:hypothetical protein